MLCDSIQECQAQNHEKAFLEKDERNIETNQESELVRRGFF